ncbi:hypothetical protein L6164_007948 [Bauhinia variegata]|uniref:Uncharacterized protein n=1 Tax=Bauhinia variegata TaxID=167791 RepID=A0ACB9PE20_BAUVA|nr:hypothetical protein L6164_007948 [Bauhinia variegata]
MEISMEQKKATQEATSKKGGFRTMPFIIANESFEKVANVGLHVNMIMYLTNEYHYDPATATIILFLWSALSNFMPVMGAFLSDSYMGRFQVISWGLIIDLFGLILLWLTSIIPQARPPHCKLSIERCETPNGGQFMFLVSSFALMSIGAGGIRPCSLAFGADQLYNPENPENERLMKSFFSWYYVSVGVSIAVSATFIVYIQYKAGWVVGFGIPVGLMLFSTVMFFLGSSMYVKVKANKSLFTSFAQVIVVARKNRQLPLPPNKSDSWYFQKGSSLVEPTNKLRFLNKACIIKNYEKDLDSDGMVVDPWNLCSVTQVEELKALIKFALCRRSQFSVFTHRRTMAPIAVGDVIPDGTLSYLDEENKPQTVSIHSLAAGKKVVIFGVPGAFTPTCSLKHVPGFIERAEELKGKGVDELICISVNDPFVMNAWAKTYPENKHVRFLADGSAKYTQALGLELDLTERGLGPRSRRFALLVEDLKVKVANVENAGEFTVSSAEEVLKAL